MCESVVYFFLKPRSGDLPKRSPTTACSNTVLNQLKPDGYDIKHLPRDNRQGGGVAIVFKLAVTIKINVSTITRSCEYMDVACTHQHQSMRMIAIYRPTRSKKNRTPLSVFYEEFSDILESCITSQEELLIVGDLNFHVDDENDHDATHFLDILESFDLVQHVNEPTHISGHTLDLIITRPTNFVSNVTVDFMISDHSSVLCNLSLTKPLPIKKELVYRKLRQINMEDFKQDLTARLSSAEWSDDLNHSVGKYNQVLSELLDKYAPVKRRVITVR